VRSQLTVPSWRTSQDVNQTWIQPRVLERYTSVLSQDPRPATNDTSNIYHDAHTKSTASPPKSATSSHDLTRAYGDGLSPGGVDSAGEAESSRTTLSSSPSGASTMVLSNSSKYIFISDESAQVVHHLGRGTLTNALVAASDSTGHAGTISASVLPHLHDVDESTVSQEDIASLPWATETVANTIPDMMPTSYTSSSSLPQGLADPARDSAPLSDLEQTIECFYYTEDREYVQQVGMICTDDVALNASSSAANIIRTSTSASSRASTCTTSSTHCSHVVSTTSAWDPIKAALNWLTSATTSASSSSKCTDSASISTTDPARVALDWLTSATHSAGLYGTGTPSTTTRELMYSDDASAIVAELEATHTSYAAAGRLRPGFW
jgi:hypothetical protein